MKSFQFTLDNRYTFHEIKGSYVIYRSGKPVTWPTNTFSCIEAASRYLSTHDYVNASESHIAFNNDDIKWLTDSYQFDQEQPDMYVKKVDDIDLKLSPQGDRIRLSIKSPSCSSIEWFTTIDEVAGALDNLDSTYNLNMFDVGTQIVSSSRGVTAASAREIASKMIRVASSNIWSYAINIKNAKDKVGDVVVQFKGKRGGPGDVYMYYDVPIITWRKWLSATSKGHYFWQAIRNNFLYRKLTGDKRGKLKNAVN